MAAALIFRFDEYDSTLRREPRTKARSSDPAADNQDFALIHHGDGYGLESHSV